MQVNIQSRSFSYFTECSNHPPGLRAQFVDYTPSGFWITNANNTFVGNVAIGHAYGYWIRVDYMFEEPAYPCSTCTCPEPQEIWPSRFTPGLVMVDNSGHSNSIAGLWVKESIFICLHRLF